MSNSDPSLILKATFYSREENQGHLPASGIAGAQRSNHLNQATESTTLLTLTFYGYPDNDPAGNAIAYPQIHTVAGGTGTYDDPRTVAIVTDKNGGHWSPGTRMYVPQLSQYLIVEDECAACVPDQIDVWIDSTEANGDEVLQCEHTWTRQEAVEVEIDPPPGRPTIPTPFFDTSTGQCRQP